jgi:hypothetical protein
VYRPVAKQRPQNKQRDNSREMDGYIRPVSGRLSKHVRHATGGKRGVAYAVRAEEL